MRTTTRRPSSTVARTCPNFLRRPSGSSPAVAVPRCPHHSHHLTSRCSPSGLAAPGSRRPCGGPGALVVTKRRRTPAAWPTSTVVFDRRTWACAGRARASLNEMWTAATASARCETRRGAGAIFAAYRSPCATCAAASSTGATTRRRPPRGAPRPPSLVGGRSSRPRPGLWLSHRPRGAAPLLAVASPRRLVASSPATPFPRTPGAASPRPSGASPPRGAPSSR